MKRALIVATALMVASAAHAETYRLIQAIGNSEKETAGLTKQECEAKKREIQAVTDAIGAGGTVTCIPESLLK